MADTLATIKTLKIPTILCIDPSHTQHEYEAWLGTQHTFLLQQGADLGSRIDHCITQSFNLGSDHTILIGSDTPDLPAAFIHAALKQLQTHDIVIGPAVDGGYYLIATKKNRYLPQIFTGIHWSTSQVLKETLTIIKRHHHTVSLLPSWQDIDTPDDLSACMARNQNTAFKSSQTFTYLKERHLSEETRE